MSTSAVLALDLALTIISAGSWFAAASLCSGLVTRHRARLALGFIALGIATFLAQIAAAAVLMTSGWWFAQEKVAFALPLLLIAMVLACSIASAPLMRSAQTKAGTDAIRLPPLIPTALIAAGSAATAGLLARVVIGYPMQPMPAAALLALVILVTVLSFALLAGKSRRAIVGLAGLIALALMTSGALAWMGSMVSPDFIATNTTHVSSQVHAAGATGTRAAAAAAVAVDDLRTPSDAPGPRKQFILRAATENVTLASGGTVQSWNYGSLPGPELRVQQGDVVEVHLENVDVDAGVTIHWHGYNVPNGEDGVAGVTQDSVLPGQSFDYRFVADQPGSYWYHTHQNASRGVQRGLFGTLIVEPPGGISEQHDVVVPLHAIGGAVLLGASDLESRYDVAPGETVRVRLINTDMLPHSFQLRDLDFRVVALDGRELTAPAVVRNTSVRLAAGGRADVSFTMPSASQFLTTDASSKAWIAFDAGERTDDGKPAALDTAPLPELDVLEYVGTLDAKPVTLPQHSGRLVKAEMVLDRNPRFLQGAPNYGYTVNGAVYPQIPSVTVDPGDVVELTVANRGWETHPMHVHGHHVQVLSRNGVPATGEPLLLDTFDVRPGESWVVAIVADNPGIWMDHCHNLDHAAEGMMMALHYRGVTTPYEHGGSHANRSE